MARPVLEAMDMDTLTKGRYVQLLARGYSPKEVFKVDRLQLTRQKN
ncbi:hypothetical protein [Enterococcus faecium]|nr:hypothetical protein [Enterococcus faecium]